MILAGIDEAGYGPLLGPLVVSATAFELGRGAAAGGFGRCAGFVADAARGGGEEGAGEAGAGAGGGFEGGQYADGRDETAGAGVMAFLRKLMERRGRSAGLAGGADGGTVAWN